MMNKNSLIALENSRFSAEFCRPLYHSYNFSRIYGTVEKLLLNTSLNALPDDVLGGSYETLNGVILFFIDGFGWIFLEKYIEKFPVLRRFLQSGIVSKISSLFPSTTAAHMTCINTGLEPGQSGIYEWFIYEPALQRVIAPLPFSFAGDHKLESLQEVPFSPSELFPKATLYEKLNKSGIQSFAMQHSAISKSTYSKTIFSGAKILEYEHFSDALSQLLQLISKMKDQKFYCFVYLGEIDSVAHRKGIAGEEFEQIINHVFELLEENFFKKIPHSIKNIATLLTADHGLTSIDPRRTFYLNKEIPQIVKNFKIGRNQKPLAPAGSCRDFFMHLQEDRLNETQEILQRFLAGRAEIYRVEELIEQKLFGMHPVSNAFLNRIGNLVILPKKAEAVWWFEKNHFAQNFHAAHGGLTREEMEIPFLFLGL